MRKLHDGEEAVLTEQKVLTLLTSIQFQVLNQPSALGLTQPLLHYGNL